MFESERTESLFQRLAADFFQSESAGPALITVVGCALSPDQKHATITISVLPKTETPAAYTFAKRKLHDLQEYVRAHARVRIIPFFDIALSE